MTKDDQKSISKLLSYVLPHNPGALDLSMDPNGWVEVDEIISKSDVVITLEQVEDIVQSSPKQRFALSLDGSKIRANQGHSFPVDLGLSACQPPATLFHGTAQATVKAIMTQGLTPQSRQHVHLSPDARTARAVGMRHGKPVVLTIASERMHRAGHLFYLTENDVWLCKAVPPEFLHQ